MSTTSRRIPERLRGPIGFLSLVVNILGLVVGYILTMLGITLYYNMNGYGDKITDFESFVVVGFGLVAFALGYLGWRGFLRFSY